jgi:hypothetical protein
VYLTHYSEVRNLERLAEDMHAGVDAYVELARGSDGTEDRTAQLQAAMFEYFVTRLETHGFAGDRDAMWSILQTDVKLNTQGLEYWLDHA